jgi:DNA primase
MMLKDKINNQINLDANLSKYLSVYFNSLNDKKFDNDLDRDEILSGLNIVDVISHYIELNRFNKAKCPFHDEKTSSFSVSNSKQIFKCFGCGKSGGIIDFIMAWHNVDFISALKILKEFN